MIKFFFRIAIMLVVGILLYNFFFGDAQEKETSREVFYQTKALVSSVVGLLADEKEKFDKGKYDEALDKIDVALDKMGDVAKGSSDLLQQVQQLQERKEAIQRTVDVEADKTLHTEDNVNHVNREINDLLDDTKQLINQAESDVH